MHCHGCPAYRQAERLLAACMVISTHPIPNLPACIASDEGCCCNAFFSLGRRVALTSVSPPLTISQRASREELSLAFIELPCLGKVKDSKRVGSGFLTGGTYRTG